MNESIDLVNNFSIIHFSSTIGIVKNSIIMGNYYNAALFTFSYFNEDFTQPENEYLTEPENEDSTEP